MVSVKLHVLTLRNLQLSFYLIPRFSVFSHMLPSLWRSVCCRTVWTFTVLNVHLQVFQELREALKNARYDDSKLVMLSGSGSVFCSGIDLHYLMDDDRRMAAKKMTDALKWVIWDFYRYELLFFQNWFCDQKISRPSSKINLDVSSGSQYSPTPTCMSA